MRTWLKQHFTATRSRRFQIDESTDRSPPRMLGDESVSSLKTTVIMVPSVQVAPPHLQNIFFASIEQEYDVVDTRKVGVDKISVVSRKLENFILMRWIFPPDELSCNSTADCIVTRAYEKIKRALMVRPITSYQGCPVRSQSGSWSVKI